MAMNAVQRALIRQSKHEAQAKEELRIERENAAKAMADLYSQFRKKDDNGEGGEGHEPDGAFIPASKFLVAIRQEDSKWEARYHADLNEAKTCYRCWNLCLGKSWIVSTHSDSSCFSG